MQKCKGKLKTILEEYQLNNYRSKLGLFLLAVSTIMYFTFTQLWISEFIKANRSQLAWCSISVLFGMGAGLINTRDKGVEEAKEKSKKKKLYLLCYPFVFVMATLATFVVYVSLDNSIQRNGFYVPEAIATLVGVSLGFIGDGLTGLIEKGLPWST